MEKTFPTKDLGVGTLLYSTDPPHRLIRTTVIENKKVILEFEKRPDTDSLVLGYFNGTAEAPAKKLFENYRTLRGLIYAQLSNVK